MSTEIFDWKQFHAYRAFDEFLESFVLQRQSYVTRHTEHLDLEKAFKEIQRWFVAAFDDSKANFNDKVALQFKDAPEQARIVFANVEYLWAMPMANISPPTKRSYALRWFPAGQVVSGERYFFGYPHTIANPGSWYLRNKYWELIATLRVLSLVTSPPGFTDLPQLKRRIAEICHTAIYKGVPAKEKFAVSKVCGVHSALLHLADPERYESIISVSHREQICAVFGHVIEKPSGDKEVLLKQIRTALYESRGNNEDPDWKNRWFFYSGDVLPLWIDKKSPKQQRASSAVFDVRNEEDAIDLEGGRKEFKGCRILRSAKLVKEAKLRDHFTCQACTFHFEDQIVHVHHLDPVSEYRRPQKTKLEDLITLCPTCHYLAHYWLRTDSRFKSLEELLDRLRPV